MSNNRWIEVWATTILNDGVLTPRQARQAFHEPDQPDDNTKRTAPPPPIFSAVPVAKIHSNFLTLGIEHRAVIMADYGLHPDVKGKTRADRAEALGLTLNQYKKRLQFARACLIR